MLSLIPTTAILWCNKEPGMRTAPVRQWKTYNYVPSALKAHDWQSSINAVYDAPEIDINTSAMLFYSGSQIFCIPQTRLQGI